MKKIFNLLNIFVNIFINFYNKNTTKNDYPLNNLTTKPKRKSSRICM